MKQKKKEARLRAKQAAYEKLIIKYPNSAKSFNRPGSIKKCA